MDRARGTGAGRAGRGLGRPASREAGGSLSHRRAAALAAWILAGPALACSSIAPDLTVPIAIEIETATNPTVEESDTLAVTVRVLDRAGDEVSGAVVSLEVLDTAHLAVDGTGLGLIGLAPTSGSTSARVVAVSGNLRSDPVAFRVLPAADTVKGPASTELVVAAADSQSGPLTTTLQDLTTTPGTPVPLGARPVRYTLVYPAYADLASARAVLSNDSLAATALTASGTGSAAVVVKRRGSPQPDSAVVLATAVRGSGVTVPGSPVRFVVRFQ